jgi:hypothetical protein
MSEEHALVIVAGYQDLETARRDFETLTDRTKHKHIALRGAVLVGKDAEEGVFDDIDRCGVPGQGCAIDQRSQPPTPRIRVDLRQLPRRRRSSICFSHSGFRVPWSVSGARTCKALVMARPFFLKAWWLRRALVMALALLKAWCLRR